MVSCRELLELPTLRKIKVVGGQSGLDRHVRWVHFIDLPDVLPWVQGGELLFMTGIGLEEVESGLLKLVRGIIKKKLAGLVVIVGPYIADIPEPVLRLADEESFPIFVLPWEVKLVEVTQDVSQYIVMKQREEKSIGDLLESILFEPVYDFPTIIRRADYYGYDLTKPHQVGVIRTVDRESLLQHQDEAYLIKRKERYEQVVREALHRYCSRTLFLTRVDSVIFLMPVTVYKERANVDNVTVIQNMIRHCNEKMPDFQLTIGLGNSFADLNQAKISFDQAKLSLKIAEFVQGKNAVTCYSEVGVYKLLFELESDTLENYYQETLGGLNEYDRKHGTDLVATLLAYLQTNGNAIQAAKQLFIHKNTLAYRLKKIESITGKKLDNMHDRMTLQMGLLIGKQIVTL